jgi:transcriptional regulator with XRE-family HTH domain
MGADRHTLNSPVFSSSLSTIVKQAREKAGYDIEDLAVATGLTHEEITNIELGHDEDESRLSRVAAVLKVVP